jgi:hypothetical protein
VALLIPLVLIGLGAGVLLLARWRDPEFRGSAFAGLLYLVLFCGPLASLTYGGYGWLRTGRWDSITVGGTLRALAKLGVDTRVFDGPAWYLQSDVGWTLLVVPAALIGVWLQLSKRGK